LKPIDLHATSRTATGNGPARVLRREGRIPAVVYGPGRETVPLSVGVADIERVLKNQLINQVLINLVIDDSPQAARTVMIKELQTEPVSRNLIHADFYEVSMDRKIYVMIPVMTTGIAPGVEMGGILQIVRRELEVLCLPGEIPEAIELDVSNLGIGDSIHVSEVPVGENIEIPADVDFTVVTVISPKAEVVEEVEGEEEAEAEEETEAGEEAGA
jgi:large subunit ribosomal protein L25